MIRRLISYISRLCIVLSVFLSCQRQLEHTNDRGDMRLEYNCLSERLLGLLTQSRA